MERLKNVIAQYGRWSELDSYTNRIEAHINTDFSQAIENVKSLLETICKEICKSKSIEVENTASINSVMKKAFIAIGYPNNNMVTQISSALATIGQNIGDLRNEIGTISHGKPLEEIKERNNKVDELTREFLIDSTILVAIFLIKAFENENPRVKPEKQDAKPLYSTYDEFNDYWDELYGEYEMGNYSFLASEILYNIDFKAYLFEQKLFEDSEDERNES